MKMSEMYPSNYVSKEDAAQPITATIRTVSRQEINADGGKKMKTIITFGGNVKPMILNRGNAETLAMAYGDDSDAWVGKTVEIYVDPNVQFQGKRIGGLRVRPIMAQAMNGAVGGNALWTWDQAQAECHKHGISKDQLVAALKAAGLTGWKAETGTAHAKRLIQQKQAEAQPERGDAFDEFGEPPHDGGEIPF